MRHAMFYGTTFDRDEYKTKIIDNLPDKWDVHIVSRFKTVNIKQRKNVKTVYVYDHPIFNEKLNNKQILEAEKFLGTPFLHIFRCWIFWNKKMEKKKHLEKIFDAMAKYVIFWRDFFIKYNIEVFTGNLESTYPEIIALGVAKKLNIKIVNTNPGRITNTFMIYDSNHRPIFWNKLKREEVEDSWRLLKQKYNNKTEAEYSSIKKYANEYGSLSGSVNKIRAFTRYYKNYQDANDYDKYRTNSPQALFRDILVQMIRNMYSKRLFANVEKNTRYFMFPLQLTWEAALTYDEPFINQFDLIFNIAKCLPFGTKLVLKPHPHWRCTDVPLDVMKKMYRTENIIISNPDANTYELIKNSMGIITINSTVGLEALILEKPVVTLGHDFYAIEGVTYNVRRMEVLPEILKNVALGKAKTNRSKTITLAANYYKNLIYLSGNIGSYYNLTDDDGKKIADAIKYVAENVIK